MPFDISASGQKCDAHHTFGYSVGCELVNFWPGGISALLVLSEFFMLFDNMSLSFHFIKPRYYHC